MTVTWRAGAPVQLGRASRAGAPPPGQPPELGVEQALLDQLVQVELGGVAGQPGACRGLVPADRLGLRDDVEVQLPPRRLGERADAADLRGEVVHPSHPSKRHTSLTNTTRQV